MRRFAGSERESFRSTRPASAGFFVHSRRGAGGRERPGRHKANSRGKRGPGRVGSGKGVRQSGTKPYGGLFDRPRTYPSYKRALWGSIFVYYYVLIYFF